MRLSPIALLALTLAAPLLLAACTGDDDAGGAPESMIVYEGAQGGVTNVYAVDADTAEARQLTTDAAGSNGNPAWMPRRREVIFRSRRDGQEMMDLYAVSFEGNVVRRLTDTPDFGEWSPKFSPDGKRVTFTMETSEGEWFVAVMDTDFTSVERVAGPYDFAEFPAWTPDGGEIWFTARSPDTQGLDILSVDLDTREVTSQVSTPRPDVCPHFTHDGTRVLYASVAEGRDDMDIFAHDRASSAPLSPASDTQLTDSPEKDDYSNPSHDDETVVFLSERDGNSELYLMSADGSAQRRLTTTPDRRENVPDW
ncbi:MAG: DPP IV N-terminal domain-containing protein [Dehalococcoidia bacterium]